MPERRTADQLGDDAGDGALERELHLLALGDVLVEGVAAALDLEAGGGRTEGGHAPEDLVLAALAADDLAGALGAAGEQAADHDRARPGGDRLGHVAGVADAAVGDQGDAGGLGDLGAVEDGGELGHTDPGDQAGGAGEAGPDPDLDGVGPGLGQVAEAVGGGDVAGHDLAVRPGRLELADGLDGVVRVAVGDVDDQGVDVGVEQGLGPFQVAAADPEGGCDPQAALAVAGRLGPASRRPMSRRVISRPAGRRPPTRGSFSIRWRSSSLRASSRSMPGWAVTSRSAGVMAEATVSPHGPRLVPLARRRRPHVPGGQDADRAALGVDHHQAGHAQAPGLGGGLGHGPLRPDGVGLLDHPAQVALDPPHLLSLARRVGRKRWSTPSRPARPWRWPWGRWSRCPCWPRRWGWPAPPRG
jgi:hypothetical protein